MYDIMYIQIHERRGDYMAGSSENRKRFTTTIDDGILTEFKIVCIRNKVGMNDVLEILMQAYTDGIINLKELSE